MLFVDQLQLGLAREAFYDNFPFQRGRARARLFRIDQANRAARACVFGSISTTIVFDEAGSRIGANTRVKGIITTAQDVDVPVCLGHSVSPCPSAWARESNAF